VSIVEINHDRIATLSDARNCSSRVSWEAYIGIGELLRDQPIRLTY